MDNNFQINLTKSVNHWTLSVLCRRILWQYIFKPIYSIIPNFLSKFRIIILRLMGAKIGKGCLVCKGVDILMPWNLVMKNFVVIGVGVEIYNYDIVAIDSMTVISQRGFLCTGTHDYNHPYMPLCWRPITIGSECWLAAEVFVGPGVNVGNGAVIGARSVVTKNMPEWMVCGGNACVPIKPRIICPI